MKSKLFILFLIITVLSLAGCSTSSAEKGPVVVKDTGKQITGLTVTPTVPAADDIANPDSSNSTKGNANSTSDNTTSGDAEQKTNLSDKDNSSASDQAFEYEITLEGSKEKINAKTWHSKFGYKMIYDVDRFKVTDEDGIDNFTAPNSDPSLYPYIYLNVSRENISECTAVKNEKGNIIGYITDQYSKLVPGDNATPYGYILDQDSTKSPIDTVTIGDYTATHYIVSGGTKWNSSITEYFCIATDKDVYSFVSNYYTEAAEGFGARLRAMIDTFQLE